MTQLPLIYVGKIVHFVGVSDQVRVRHLTAVVVRVVEGQMNRVVLAIFTNQVECGAASSTKRKRGGGYSAELVPGTWHFTEDCHRTDEP